MCLSEAFASAGEDAPMAGRNLREDGREGAGEEKASEAEAEEAEVEGGWAGRDGGLGIVASPASAAASAASIGFPSPVAVTTAAAAGATGPGAALLLSCSSCCCRTSRNFCALAIPCGT